MTRPSTREVLMCLLAGVVAALIMIPLTFYAIDREMAIIEAAADSACVKRWTVTGSTVLLPGYGKGLMIHVEPIDSEVKP
jgi:hypothetical protein